MSSDQNTNQNGDHFDKLAEQFSEQEQEKREEIYQANSHGNGFADDMEDSKAPEQYNPKKLNAKHREIIRLTALGYKGVMIAKMLSVTPQTVYNITNSPLGESLLQEIENARTGNVKDVRDRLQEASPLAVELVVDIMSDGKSEKNKLRAALKVLEMTGHKPGENHQHVHTHLSKDDIDDIKEEVGRGPTTVPESSNQHFNETNKPEPNDPNKDIQDAEIIEEEEG